MACYDNPNAAGSLTRVAARRNKILSAARRLFSTKGFHATGIAQISAQSGIAVGQIYRDFVCKECLVAEIVESDCSILKVVGNIKHGDFLMFRTWIMEFISHHQYAVERSQLFAEIIAESSRNARIRAIFENRQAQERENLLNALCTFVASPSLLPKCEIFADMIMTLSLGMMMHRLMGDNIDFARLFGSICKFVDQGLYDINETRSGSISPA